MHLKCSQFLVQRRLTLRLLLGGVAASVLLGWSHRTLAAPLVGESAEQLPFVEVPSPEVPSPEVSLPDELMADEPLSPDWIVDDDIPEEILRTEIITGARSPLTGEVLSAAEYAQLQATLQGPAGDTLISDDLRYLIFLLQFRRAVSPIIPFL